MHLNVRTIASTLLCLAGLLVGENLARAQTWTVGFNAGTPETSMRTAASFAFKVTNTGTVAISKVVLPLPAGYSGIGGTTPANWQRKVTGTSVAFEVKAGKCSSAIAANGGTLVFTIAATPAASGADRTDALGAAGAAVSTRCSGTGATVAPTTSTAAWKVHGLRMGTVSVTPASVAVGQAITLTAGYTNLASTAVSAGTTTGAITWNGGITGTCVVTSNPLVAANTAGSVSWACTPGNAGTVTFTVASLSATATGTVTTLTGTTRSSAVTVVGSLGNSFTLTPTTVAPGHPFQVSEDVYNGTGAAVTNVLPNGGSAPGCSCTGGATCSCGAFSPASATSLADKTAANFKSTCTVGSKVGTCTVTTTAQATLAGGGTKTAAYSASVDVNVTPPSAPTAFHGTGLEGTDANKVALAWTYVDGTTPHDGALIIAAASATGTWTTWTPAVQTTYSVNQDLGNGATVVAFIQGDTGTYGSALVTLPAAGTHYFRIFAIAQGAFYSTGFPSGSLAIPHGVGDGRLFSYVNGGYTALARPLASQGLGLFGSSQDASLPVYALAPDGTELWRPADLTVLTRPVQARVVPLPLDAFGADYLVVLDQTGGNVTTVNATTGETGWQMNLGAVTLQATPAAELLAYVPATSGLTDDLIVVATNDANGAVYGLTGGGIQAWRFAGTAPQKMGPITGQPTIDYQRDIVYVGSAANNGPTVWAIDAATGAERWAGRNIGDVTASMSPSFGGETLYVPTSSGLYALDLTASFADRWSISGEIVKGFVYPRPGSVSGTNEIYYVTATAPAKITKRVHTISTNAQAPSWPAVSLPGSVTATGLTIADGIVYVGGSDGVIYSVDGSTGATATAWKSTGAGILGTPVFDASLRRLYVSSVSGTVIAYPLPTLP